MLDLSIPVKSDLIIKGYTYTIAQKEMIKYLSQQDKEKLTDIIIFHFQNKEKRYKLSQTIFDELPGKLDNMLFADLCFCNDIAQEQVIMNEYYSGYDFIESQRELNSILNNEYLNLFPELKNEVRERLITNLGLS